MYSFNSRGYVAIQNGTANGRSLYETLKHGRITISGRGSSGKAFQRVVQVVDGEIMDMRLREGGRLVHHIAYGKFETLQTPAGREVTRFAKGTGKGKHGKSVRFARVFGTPGTVHSWFKHGRLVRQKFVYANGRLAYDWQGRGKVCVIRAPGGGDLYRVLGRVDGREMWNGKSVFGEAMEHWFLHSAPFKVELRQRGAWKEWFAGQYVRGQKQGRWVEGGRVRHYEHGVVIPPGYRKMLTLPKDQLDPVKVLKIANAQLRMAMLAKVGTDRLAKQGRLIHKQGAMRLWAVKGMDERILRVQCPSTKSFYYIRVPHDSDNCERARQWTFHVGAGVFSVRGGKIKFAQET